MSMSRSSLFCPPVSQVQQLLSESEEHTGRRQVSCGGEIGQKKSALASVEHLQSCGLCRGIALKGVPLQHFIHKLPGDPVVMEDVLELKIVKRHRAAE